jgi:hypothetical protein
MPGALSQTQERGSWSDVVSTTLRLIFFRASRAELIDLGWKHLAFGLCCAWLVGIGRYWDNPRVGLAQHLGLGSVAYVFVLALFLWLIVWPLRPQHWSYFRVLTFVSLVSPPAILYAIPVEYFCSVDTANSLNLLFLAVVATWRVALLVFSLRRLGELDWFSIIIATLLPLTLIIVTLTVLNLEKAVFSIMGGIQEPTASDASYGFLVLLSYFSILIFIPLAICYLVLSIIRFVEYRQRRKRAEDGF